MRFKQVGHGQREDLTPEKVGTFPEPYLHYNFSHGSTQWLRKHAGYAEAEAEQIFRDRQGDLRPGDIFTGERIERRRALKRLVNRLPVLLRPPLRFFHAYVLRRGFLEGREGLQYAAMLSCYEAMIATHILDKRASKQASLYQ
jgi:hypothetical protein